MRAPPSCACPRRPSGDFLLLVAGWHENTAAFTKSEGSTEYPSDFGVHPNYQVNEPIHRETLENLGRSPSAVKHVHIVFSLEACEGLNAYSCATLQRVSSEDRRTPVRGQAVEQSAEMRSALEFFATGQSFPECCQAYKNEVYFLLTELD